MTTKAGTRTPHLDAEADATARAAADYLREREFPQAAAIAAALEAVAPGRYRVRPQGSHDDAGNQHYAIVDAASGEREVSGLTYGGLLRWVGERADDRSSAQSARTAVVTPSWLEDGAGGDAPRPPALVDQNGVPTARGLRAMFAATDR